MSLLELRIPEPQPVKEDDVETQGSKTSLDAAVSHLIQASYAKLSTVLPKAPEIAYLGSLRDHRFRVSEPLVVAFQADESQIVVEASEIDEFGFGSTYSEALADLQRTIVELFFSLKADESRLGADLQRVWQTLRRKVELVSE